MKTMSSALTIRQAKFRELAAISALVLLATTAVHASPQVLGQVQPLAAPVANAPISAQTKPTSFNDVLKVVNDEIQPPASSPDVIREWAVYRSGTLPQYQMNMTSIFATGTELLEQAAKRTVSEKADYLDRLPKLLHPNGVCVVGEWESQTNEGYTGAFAPGARALFIGRISVAMEKTTNASSRGFDFAGKLFPTMDPSAVVSTENFFTVDVLMGTRVPRFLDTATTNEPEVGFDLGLIRLGLKISSALSKADANPGFRPLRNLARLGASNTAQIQNPKWIRISPVAATIKNNEADFRTEVVRAARENQILTFNVDVSNTTKDRSASTGWQHLGVIRVQDAVVSYGCDRRLHFGHPKLNN